MKTVNPNANIYFYISNAFQLDIDISKYWMEKDEQKEGSIAKSDFINSLRWLPLGLLENDIKRIMDQDVIYTSSGRVDYYDIMNSDDFKKILFSYNIRQQLQ